MAKQCSYVGCTNPVFSNGRCSWHRTPKQQYNKSTEANSPTSSTYNSENRIRTFSVKRTKENAEYSKLSKKFKEENKFCQAKLEGCSLNATQVHHKKGRIGSLLNDLSLWLAVCDSCHKQIEAKPKMAFELGLSVSRLAK